uniref:Kazal-like domain-containing protein n=1 Tax=Timema bartmani TaxID=61472 RepID=A0A7R9F5B8_9NEOP|nr:unnamed protein product [Timema bartmani]
MNQDLSITSKPDKMRLTSLSSCPLVVVAVIVVGCAARPGHNGAPPDCKERACPLDAIAICAGDGVNPPQTFIGTCSLFSYNCDHGTDLQVIKYFETCENLASQNGYENFSENTDNEDE